MVVVEELVAAAAVGSWIPPSLIWLTTPAPALVVVKELVAAAAVGPWICPSLIWLTTIIGADAEADTAADLVVMTTDEVVSTELVVAIIGAVGVINGPSEVEVPVKTLANHLPLAVESW